MSSSLFDSCGSYEFYPKTYIVEGDKPFKNLVKGDTIYYCNPCGDVFELTVTNELKKSKNHLYLYIKGLDKTKTINFGPTNCHNVVVDAPNNSIVEYLNGFIGTNKASVVGKSLEIAKKEFNYIHEMLMRSQHVIDNLKNNKL
jgi:hypothetical protein